MSEGGAQLGRGYGSLAGVVRWLLQHLVLFPILRMITPIVVRERRALEGLPRPLIVASNHVSHLDTPVVLRVLPPRIRGRLVVAAAKDYFYRGRVRGTLVSLAMATIPFDRGEGSRDSLRLCQSLLRGGWSLLIFPEGTRSPSGELGRVRHGVAVLAVDTGTPVLPVFVHGLHDVMPKGKVAPLPGGVVVDVGEVVRPGPGEDASAFRDRAEAALRRLSERRPGWGTEPPHLPDEDPDARDDRLLPY
jgi:1-acyl-sn-glycerol-3-phosphate acyltransferase